MTEQDGQKIAEGLPSYQFLSCLPQDKKWIAVMNVWMIRFTGQIKLVAEVRSVICQKTLS